MADPLEVSVLPVEDMTALQGHRGTAGFLRAYLPLLLFISSFVQLHHAAFHVNGSNHIWKKL